MMTEELKAMLHKGENALQNGDTLVALLQFETVHAIEPVPGVKSKLAFCLAKERHQYQRAMSLCREALQIEPDNPDHYYQLSRIHLLSGQKRKAIRTLRKGLKFKRHQSIIDELIRLGARQESVFEALPREHVLNRITGLFLTKIGLR